MAKTVFLQIRITPEDRDRLKLAAVRDYLDLSTWARRVLLAKIDEMEGTRPELPGRGDRKDKQGGGSSSAKKKKRR